MNDNRLKNIDQLIDKKEIDLAENQISKLGPEYFKNSEYLFLRSKIFYVKKLYYIALDTLLISLEFHENEKTFNLIEEIYNILGNKELSKKIGNPNLRLEAITSLKKELTGISQKGYEI